MYRDIPISNKICATKEIFQNQVILNNHVLTMRPQIDTSAPRQYEFLKNQKIKEAIKQQKQQEIDRENRNLISKITYIMQQQTNNSISTLPLKRSESQNTANIKKKSLNKDYRKKELIKIVMENQQLLKRIQDQKSQYNVKNWNEERKWVEKYISNISEYPYKDFKPTKTLVQYWTNTRISESQLQKRESTTQHKKLDPLQTKSQQSKYRTRQDNNLIQEPQQSLFASDYQPYQPMSQEQFDFQDPSQQENQQKEQQLQENKLNSNHEEQETNNQLNQQNQLEVQEENLEESSQNLNQEQDQQQDEQQIENQQNEILEQDNAENQIKNDEQKLSQDQDQGIQADEKEIENEQQNINQSNDEKSKEI